MKWDTGEESENVEDRRGGGGGGGGGDDSGGGGGGFTGTHAGMGVGATIVIALVAYFLGIDPNKIGPVINGGGGGGGGYPSGAQNPQSHHQPNGPGVKDRSAHFIRTITNQTEKVWDEQFQKLGKSYRHPKVVMYSGKTETRGCGVGAMEMGPFYCPADETVYIDPSFYDELEKNLGGSKADFSQAYVIAHEIGHHVQKLLGYSDIVDQKRRELSKAEFNKWSVRLELQADYLAGVWAHYGDEKFHFIEKGDAEEAIKSANSIGDDTLQSRGGARPSPQNYTHGTSKQRVKWYKKGLETGDFSQLKVIFDLPYEQL